jgi:hypothetical protein
VNKKKKNPFSWPFAKLRQQWIDRADQFIAEGAEELEDCDPAIGVQKPMHVRKYRRAARYYERSAEYYRKAGLGAMALASWQDAAECWATVGDESECHRCEAEAATIEVFYEEGDE